MYCISYSVYRCGYQIAFFLCFCFLHDFQAREQKYHKQDFLLSSLGFWSLDSQYTAYTRNSARLDSIYNMKLCYMAFKNNWLQMVFILLETYRE